MKLTKLTFCQDGGCHNVYLTDRNTVVFQGSVVPSADGPQLSPGEGAVELRMDVVVEMMNAWPTKSSNALNGAIGSTPR